MSKYCDKCGMATSEGLMGTIYYCKHTPKVEESLEGETE